ncbi:Isocitrate dehydrogenase [Liquorilactobacillus aquaticus DSM 21051]|uniref:Isocitrate dehydrogenase [NADP] n=1 Tax=Liquorilactobacillus aquaticus DSM 21051 TaxID=1423725 RepID=A0A0R2CYN1_9LACO|nr:NADP-dependent isocitrate dehydrogenase [Liquorilactobacillus aquaticus]KRM96957.1 Isocitrate dehydrogenase [Liquorilactobacillus aquaticus DSM 21051]
MEAKKIQIIGGELLTPDVPTIPFIAGDGIGPEIWGAAKRVFDEAVKKAYADKREVNWLPLSAGENAYLKTGEWLPDKTVEALKKYLVAIKGPLTTPVGHGHRSINVTLRQELDLFACFRPVKYYAGTPSPVRDPEKVNIAVFRENTEDIYAGIDFDSGSPAAGELLELLEKEGLASRVRFPKTSAFALKPVSSEGTKRLVNAAITYALEHEKQSVTLVHKGNIMKKTEGSFKKWGYEIAESFGNKVYTMARYEKTKKEDGEEAAQKQLKTAKQNGKVIVKDIIADNFFQQSLLNPEQFDVVATLNLNGDYISDALAAQVGGIGISPGANINYQTGQAIFEATHGTAPQFAGLNKLNPTSLILSGAMMFDYIGWKEAAELIEQAVAFAISHHYVTEDFAQKIPGAHELGTSEFADYIISKIETKSYNTN